VKLSIVIPVLNEERRIVECLERVAKQSRVSEIIVVDGGSSDRTREVGTKWADDFASCKQSPIVHFASSSCGRAHQQNRGAKIASGDVLLFLHADTTLPPCAADSISEALAVSDVVAGAFRTWHVPERWRGKWRAWLLHAADLRSRYSSLPYGDQAFFVRAKQFHAVGGFPPLALMEDLELSRRLKKRGRIRIVNRSVLVSGRRFEDSLFYQTFLVNIFPLLYALGISPSVLARFYGNPR